MDAHLIPNEKGQLAEEAMETTQPQQQRPPSYTVTNGYPNGPTQPQQGYIIQNIPVQQNSGCCGGRSQWFKHSVGMTTGVIQIVLALMASILSGVTIYLEFRYEYFFSPAGYPIAATIFFFLPAGILGACTKGKNNCVIVGYLVMSILSAIHAILVFWIEAKGAYTSVRTIWPDYFPPNEDGTYHEITLDDALWQGRYKDLTALHAVIAVLMFIEFIVAIVASAICCRGLNCCFSRATPQTNTNTMMYYPSAGMQPMPAQMGTPDVQGSELPAKA